MPRKTWFWSFSGKWMYILLSSNVKRGANWLNISKYFVDLSAFPKLFVKDSRNLLTIFLSNNCKSMICTIYCTFYRHRIVAAAGLEHMTTRIWNGRLESTATADLITNTEFSLDLRQVHLFCAKMLKYEWKRTKGTPWNPSWMIRCPKLKVLKTIWKCWNWL